MMTKNIRDDWQHPVIDIQEFLALSSFLNYQLSGEPVNWRGILNLMVDDRLDQIDEEYLLEALYYLVEAYGEQKRRLGPLAILHPLRSVALLAKAQADISTLDLVTTLFHDKNEDITRERYDAATWDRLVDIYQGFQKRVGIDFSQVLNDRIGFLTKGDGQKYYDYLGKLLAVVKFSPELAAIKLADRLDNTMDLRVDLHDFTEEHHFYQILFDILYVNSYQGLNLKKPHPINRKINGAMRLYQLYKNAVFSSLLRAEKIELNKVGQRLFFSLAMASIREAQTILLHIFAYHLQDPQEQRRLLMEVISYAQEGGFGFIREKSDHLLDGLFKNYFEHDSKEKKENSLANLYVDKKLMGGAALSFIIIFANFINDENFTIKGISKAGITIQK